MAVVAVTMAAALGLAAFQAASTSMLATGLLVAATATPLVALAVGGLRRLLLAIVIFDIPLNWDVNFSYDNALSSLGAIGGLSISLTTVALAGLYLLWAGELSLERDRAATPRVVWAGPLLVYALALGGSVAFAARADLAVFEVWIVIQALLLFIYLVSWITTRDRLEFVVLAVVAGLGIQGALIVLTQYAGLNIDLPGLATTVPDPATIASGTGTGGRAGGTTGSPNTTGDILAATLLVGIAILLGRVSGLRFTLTLGAAAVGTVALILTFSRGAWLAFALGLAVLFVMYAAKRRLSRRVASLAVGAVILGAVFGGVVQQRIESNTQSALARIPLAATALAVVDDHTLTGVGANNYAVALPSYAETNQYAFIPHNKFLLVWAEAGLIGLLAFAAIVVVWLARAFSAVLRSNAAMFPIAAAVAAGILAQAIHMNIEPFHGRPEINLFVLLGALATVLSRGGLATHDEVPVGNERAQRV